MGWLAHCTRPSALTAMTASCMLLRRVSSWRWLERDGGETAFDLSGGFVDGGGDTTDLIEGTIFDTGAEIPLLDAGGDIHDALEAARGPDGGGSRDEQGDNKAMADPQSRRRCTCDWIASTSESG